MSDKSTTIGVIHQIPAGMMSDDKRTEIFGCRESKKTYFISEGVTSPFEKLNGHKKSLIFEQLLDDDVALNDLKHLPQDEALAKFAFCIYGAADHVPDFDENGNLNESDNFLCSNNCTCIKWKSKNITVDGKPLTKKQIEVVTLLATDLADKQIADKMGITQSTLDSHKTKIFELFGVHGKPGLITKAINQKIIQ